MRNNLLPTEIMCVPVFCPLPIPVQPLALSLWRMRLMELYLEAIQVTAEIIRISCFWCRYPRTTCLPLPSVKAFRILPLSTEEVTVVGEVAFIYF